MLDNDHRDQGKHDEKNKLKPPRNEDSAYVSGKRWELLDRISSALDKPTAVLALVWIVVLVVELVLALPEPWSQIVYQVDITIWAVFAVQFFLELFLAPKKLIYLRNNWITALSVVLPFFRVLRIARLLQAFKGLSLASVLLRTNRALGVIANVVRRSRVMFIGLLLGVASIVGAAAVYSFEQGTPGATIHTFGDALWWALTVATTINSSPDPVTFEGRIVGLVLRVLALSAFGYVTAFVASYLIGSEKNPSQPLEEKLETLHQEIELLRQELRSSGDNPGASPGPRDIREETS